MSQNFVTAQVIVGEARDVDDEALNIGDKALRALDQVLEAVEEALDLMLLMKLPELVVILMLLLKLRMLFLKLVILLEKLLVPLMLFQDIPQDTTTDSEAKDAIEEAPVEVEEAPVVEAQGAFYEPSRALDEDSGVACDIVERDPEVAEASIAIGDAIVMKAGDRRLSLYHRSRTKRINHEAIKVFDWMKVNGTGLLVYDILEVAAYFYVAVFDQRSNAQWEPINGPCTKCAMK